jgi:hypothetical protein
MESCFFVEAKSFLFSVTNGSDELRMVEKRKGFIGFVLLSSRCTVWLVPMVEEALHSTVSEDFVISFGEDSKVTIVQSGRSSCDQFLEVVVYAVGGRIGMTMFHEGRDGRGLSRVSGELKNALLSLKDLINENPKNLAYKSKCFSHGQPPHCPKTLSFLKQKRKHLQP